MVQYLGVVAIKKGVFTSVGQKDRIYVSTKPPAEVRCDKRFIFMQSLTDFHSEFSFSKTGCHTKAKEPSSPNYFTLRENSLLHTFHKRNVKCKQLRPRFELG